MNTDDLRRQYKGVAYPPLVAAICFFDSEGFEDDANQAAEKYASYQAIATAAREVMRKHDAKAVECNFTICGCDYCDVMRPQLAALEQETK